MKKPNWTKAADILSEQIYKDLKLMNNTQKHTQHTPGPWAVNRSGNRIMVDTRMETICQANGVANARLIAAAPELLEALQQVIAWNMTASTERDWTSYRLAMIEQVRAAIARAQGKVRGE